MRLIDADALLEESFERICSDCDKRKGVKSGKYRIIYNVGDAPCRACEIDDMKGYLDDAPTIDAVPVVRCKDCKYYMDSNEKCELVDTRLRFYSTNKRWTNESYCSWGERKDGDVDG